MNRINYLDKFELGDILKLQVARIGEKGIFLINEKEKEGKDNEVFLPFFELKERLNKYEYIFVGVDLDGKGKKIANPKLDEVVQKYASQAEGMKRGDTYQGKIYNVTGFGAFALSEEKIIGFVHEGDINTPLKVGDRVEGRITFVRPDGRINFSLRPLKEVGRLTDAEKILELLKKRNGMMPYSDETPAEVIKDKFGISKSAFKRAIGKLLKDGLIEQKEGWTYLLKK